MIRNKSVNRDGRCASCIVRLPNGRDFEVVNEKSEEDLDVEMLFTLLCQNLSLKQDSKYFALLGRDTQIDSSSTSLARFLLGDESVYNLQKEQCQILLQVVIVPKNGEIIQSSFVLELFIFHFASVIDPVIPAKDSPTAPLLNNLATVRQYLLESSIGISIACKRITDSIMKSRATKCEFVNAILTMENYRYIWYTTQPGSTSDNVHLGINLDGIAFKKIDCNELSEPIPWSKIVSITRKKKVIKIQCTKSIMKSNSQEESIPHQEAIMTFSLTMEKELLAQQLYHHLFLCALRLSGTDSENTPVDSPSSTTSLPYSYKQRVITTDILAKMNSASSIENGLSLQDEPPSILSRILGFIQKR